MTKCHYSILAGVEGPRGSTNACGTVTEQLDHPELSSKNKKRYRRRRDAPTFRDISQKVHFVQTVPATGRLEEHVLAPQF
jgi:hypothetical protein